MVANLHVHVISTGGTISMVPTASGLLPTLAGRDLVGVDFPERGSVSFEAYEPLPGASLTAAGIDVVVQGARNAVMAGAAGVVVTQGTDNLEETAFLMDLLWERPEPIVVTGAMRAATAPGFDGQGNLSAAIDVARDSSARNRGVLVVMGDEVFSALSVAKVHSSRVSAFAAPGVGPLASIGENHPRWLAAPHRADMSRFPSAASPASVPTVTIQFDQSADILEWATHSDTVRGVVIAAMGVGHVPIWCLESLSTLSSAKPVTYVSRTGAGSVFTGTYGFPGSERDLIERGLFPAGSLNAHKARILLAQCIHSSNGRLEAESIFNQCVSALST